MIKIVKNTKALVTILYPIIERAMNSHLSGYKKCIERFLANRNAEIYDTAPYDRIYFKQPDLDDFYISTGLNADIIKAALEKTYYWEISPFNPAAAKDEFTVAVLMIIRYLFLKNKTKELELSMIYLSFSGKFYPSIHYSSFPKAQPSQYRFIMEYVVNNELSQKFDLKSQGSNFGVMKSITTTWLNSYKERIRRMYDEDAVYVIQQLHGRIKSFMQNIASLYYKAYEDKDYLTYDSEDHSEDNYRLVNSDSTKAQKCVEKAMNAITQSEVDYRLCKMAADNNVHTDEIKSIIESILNSKENLPEVKELISLLVFNYYRQSKTKDIRDIDFITYSISPKPNSKDEHINRSKEIVEHWLEENSPAYRRRRSRLGTKNSYHRSVFVYFTLATHNANK